MDVMPVLKSRVHNAEFLVPSELQSICEDSYKLLLSLVWRSIVVYISVYCEFRFVEFLVYVIFTSFERLLDLGPR
jgi:hypothetical protein